MICTACSKNNPDALSACGADFIYSGSDLREPIPAEIIPIQSGPASGLLAAERVRLTEAVDRAFSKTSATSMTAAVWQIGGQPWMREIGTTGGQLHYWASVGKIVTATAILRLEIDGGLSLDDSIAKYVVGVPDGDTITLRMLLNHTSGLFSVNEDPQIRATGVTLDLPTVLAVLKRQQHYACPGTYWRYSNTGYTRLGAVIENVVGQPYHQATTDLVLSRSAAKNIRMLSPGANIEDVVPLAPQGKVLSVDMRGPQAAGGVVADSTSIVVFSLDLFNGRILPKANIREMFAKLFPMMTPKLWYGLGVMAYDVPGAKGEMLWLGHSGGIEGGKAVVAYVPLMGAIVAVALTDDGSAEASANLLLSMLNDEE